MRKFHITLALLLAFPTLTYAQLRLQSFRFYSRSVHDTMHVRVLLPQSYDHSRSYPALFVLHGYGGDETDWTTKIKLEDYTPDLQVIIIMPEAKNSWYTNSETDPGLRYEDYIMQDLPAFINSAFPIDTVREAIAGISMGGYGALVLALRHPKRFLFAGDLSGAITAPGIIDSAGTNIKGTILDTTGKVIGTVMAAFGKDDKKFRDEHDIFVLLERERADSLPYIFCATGIQDSHKDFLPVHRKFTNLLREYNKSYEYHEVPGGHDWKLWNEEVRVMIERMTAVMGLRSQK